MALYQQILEPMQRTRRHPLAQATLNASCAALAGTLKTWQTSPDGCSKAIFESCTQQNDLADIEALAAQLRGTCDHLLVIGSGGSGLSAKVLAPLAAADNRITLHVVDHVDPAHCAALVRRLPLEKTAVLIISKSGHTVETMSVALALFGYAAGQAASLASRSVVITVATPSPLRQWAEQMNIRTLTHLPDLCGRFSVLSAVGLLPAAVLGVNIRALREGATSVIQQALSAQDPSSIEAARGAAAQHWFMTQNYPISVLMAYSETWAGLTQWYRQGWAESLGKNGVAATPYASIGPCDQHSQLQLYLSGAADKYFTFLLPECEGEGDIIPVPEYLLQPLGYLHGRHLGDVLAAEARATCESLIGHDLPVRILHAKASSAQAMGALLAHFMLEIMFTASLLNVNPYDQPAVEESKAKARQYLTEMRA